MSVKPQCALKLVVAVDGATVRVEFERSALQHLLGASLLNEKAVRAFLSRNRKGIESAIQAHLFAHGVPLDRHLVMSMDDLHALHPA